PMLTARENLEFYAELFSIADPHAAAELWLSRVGLAEVADNRVRTFSRGMQQRLSAARAMLAEPALLLVDEPFASLDHDAAEIVAGLLRGAIERGASVIATAHAVPEIDGVEFAVFEISRGLLLPHAHKEEVRRGRIRSVLRKDLRLELRSGESTLALLALSMLVLVVLVFALDAARVRSVDAAAGALWVAMVFAGMLGANRALLAERDNGAIRGLLLSPLDPATLYAAKLAAALIFMAVAEVG